MARGSIASLKRLSVSKPSSFPFNLPLTTLLWNGGTKGAHSLACRSGLTNGADCAHIQSLLYDIGSVSWIRKSIFYHGIHVFSPSVLDPTRILQGLTV
jgi:hypothetical protein